MTGATPRILPCNERAVVFFNGECDLAPDFFRKSSFYAEFDFVATDGGANIALRYGVIPAAVIGDMDSITASNRRKLEKLSRFVIHPVEKEKSDGQLALEFLLEQGYNDIHIFAATGGRIDQTLFNLQLLSRFPQCRIITDSEEITAVVSGSVLHQLAGCRASLIPTTPEVKGLTLEGFKYNLAKANIKYGSTLTLSNVIISDRAKISFQEGGLILVVSRTPEFSFGRQATGLKLIKGKKNSKYGK